MDWQDAMFRTNICAVSVVLFPFCFWSKQKFFKNIIIFVGIISGVAAVIYPDEILGDPVDLKVFKFYWQHIIICMVPILMLSLNIYKVNFKDIAWIPLMFTMYQMIVIFNQAVQFKLGFNHNNIDHTNRALQWKTGDFAVIFDWLTPTFMRPLPIFSTIIPLHFFMWIFSALIVLIYKLSKKELHFSDIRKIKNIRFSTLFKKKPKVKTTEVNATAQVIPNEAKPEPKDTKVVN
ncbi:MAG: hypothetical protein LBC44_03580 [Mycoplasmataceae bacterium]|nr:hypothetical protein [Mycoplasmataceae bacterium]